MEMKEDSLAAPSFDDLPNEILIQIFSHIRFADRIRMSTVCRRWNQLVFAFFCDRIKLHLGASTNYSVPVGKLSDRIYQNVQVFWTEDSSGWLDAIEELAPKLLSLDLYIMPEKTGFLAKWNPPPSLMDQVLGILGSLDSLTTLFINITPTTFGAILGAIHDLPNLATLTIEIRIDNDKFALSGLNDLCRLPKLRTVSICSYDPLCAPEKDYLVPAPFVESLTLELYSNYFSFTIVDFYKLFPCLTQLNVCQVELGREDFEQVVDTWPALEVLAIGLTSLMEHSATLEFLHRLPKLRKLELRPQSEEDVNLAGFSVVEKILQIPTLEELRLDHVILAYTWLNGKIPTNASSCRLYIDGVFVPRSSTSSSSDSE